MLPVFQRPASVSPFAPHLVCDGRRVTIPALPQPGRIYRSWRDAPWDDRRWPNFPRIELACRCALDGRYCAGEMYWDPDFFDRLQALRTLLGRPVKLNSAHRCDLRNASVGGKPLSQHKKMAADIDLTGHDRERLYRAAREVGFSSFGFYRSFLHVDMRPGRRWFSSQGARELWTDLVT